jgi:hypothetical protein
MIKTHKIPHVIASMSNHTNVKISDLEEACLNLYGEMTIRKEEDLMTAFM